MVFKVYIKKTLWGNVFMMLHAASENVRGTVRTRPGCRRNAHANVCSMGRKRGFDGVVLFGCFSKRGSVGMGKESAAKKIKNVRNRTA